MRCKAKETLRFALHGSVPDGLVVSCPEARVVQGVGLCISYSREWHIASAIEVTRYCIVMVQVFVTNRSYRYRRHIAHRRDL